MSKHSKSRAGSLSDRLRIIGREPPRESGPPSLLLGGSGCRACKLAEVEVPGSIYNYDCRTCGRTSKRLIPRDAEKALFQPQTVRHLMFDLMSSDDRRFDPFALMMLGCYPRWELQGLGSTEEYPVEIQLNQMADGGSRVIIRHGELWNGREDLLITDPKNTDKAVADSAFFQYMSAKFEKAGMKFVTALPIGRHLFTGTFQIPGNDKRKGIIAYLWMPTN